MADIQDIFKVDEFFTQTRLKICATVNCANRQHQDTSCNLKEIEMKHGRCLSFVKKERDDLVIVEPKKEI